MAIRTRLSNTGTLTLSDIGSVYFDGNDYLTIPHNTALDIGTGDYTIEGWWYFTDTSNQAMISKYAATLGYAVQYQSGNLRMVLGLTVPGGGDAVYTFPWTPVTNTWYHVAITRSGSSGRAFINGTQIGSTTTFTNANVGTTADLQIGSTQTVSEFTRGAVSNVRIVKGTALYTSNFTPSTQLLTAITNTSLLTCQSAYIVDKSTNNFPITLVGNPSLIDFSPFTPQLTESVIETGSFYFDGSGVGLTLPASSVYSFTGNFTWECWVYFNSLTSFRALVGNYTANAATDWYIDTSGTTLRVYIDGGTPRLSTTVATSIWYHVAIVRNGSTITGYLNGVSFGTYTTSSTIGTASKQIFIGNQGGTAEFINGYISNVRIINGTAVYTTNFTPSTNLTNVLNTVLLLKPSSSELWLKDDSVNNFAVTPNGNVAYNSFSPEITTRSFSTYFDGSGDYLTAPNNAAFSLGTNDFTIEGWVNYNALTNSGIFQIGATLFPGTNGIGLGLDATNPPFWMLYYGNGAQTAATTKPISNIWYHFAVVKSSSVTRLYINGVATSISVSDTANYTGTVLGIGGIYSTNYIMNGYLSNFRIVKGTALYTANFTPPTSPLTAIANTSLLTCQDQTIRDASTNNFTITKNGDTTWSALTPFRDFKYKLTDSGLNLNTIDEVTLNSGSLYFDGSGDFLTLPTGNTALALGNSNFTVEAWVYRVSGTGGAAIFGGQSDLSTVAGSSYIFYVSATATSDLYIGGTAYPITSPNPAFGTWNHVAWVRNGGTFTSYLNGVQVGNRTDLGSGSINVGAATAPPAIGAFSSGINSLIGYITNLRLVKGTALYTGNFTPPTAILDPITNTPLLLNCLVNEEFRDSSTNNFTLTRNGNVGPSTFSPFYQNRSGSLYFDNVNDYLTCPSSTAFGLGTGNFTIELWAYILNVGENNWIIDLRTAGGGSSQVKPQLAVYATGGIGYYYGASVVVVATSSGLVISNNWHHIAVVRNSGVSKIYLDGIERASASDTIDFGSAATVTIGTVGDSPGFETTEFNGYISNLRFVKGTAVYTSNFTPSRNPLTAVPNTSLLLNTASAATDITDSSPNNFTVTRAGETVFSNMTPVSNPPAQKLFPDSTILIRDYTEYIVPPFVPVADFIASPLSGAPPLTVAFTDRSNNVPTSWAWDFTNDGTTDSTSRNTSTTYSSSGTYSVRLTASNAAGSNTLVKTSYITVRPAPSVNFTASTTSGFVPLVVNFTDLSSNSPTSWAWDFDNNGSTDSTNQNPSYTYSSAGTYSVKLTATNVGGSGTLTRTSYITASVNVVGEQSYTSPGSYSFTVPANVTSISVVCVGGGGGGSASADNGSGAGPGGGGGGLRYQNSIAVTPGQIYSVVVGAGGAAGQNQAGQSSSFGGVLVANGGSGASQTVGPGGAGGGGTTIGGDVGGGNGGQGGSYTESGGGGGGGGGAGGYSGAGGAGGSGGNNSGSNGTAGSNGLGGGGGGGGGGADNFKGGNGGGVGILGQGTAGSGGTAGIGLAGGSGTAGSGGSGNIYGGGGGGASSGGAGAGSGGAVRIIWGSGRSFPNNAA